MVWRHGASTWYVHPLVPAPAARYLLATKQTNRANGPGRWYLGGLCGGCACSLLKCRYRCHPFALHGTLLFWASPACQQVFALVLPRGCAGCCHPPHAAVLLQSTALYTSMTGTVWDKQSRVLLSAKGRCQCKGEGWRVVEWVHAALVCH